MKSVARQRVSVPVEQKVGRVVKEANGEGLFGVDLDGYRCEARRAVSCLVEPFVGDTVLAVVHADGIHVLAILDRPSADAPTRLACGLNVEIQATERISMMAPHVEVNGLVSTAMRGQNVAVRAVELDVVAGEATLCGHAAVVEVERIKTVAETRETSAERSIERLGHAYRFVRDSEEVHADRLHFTAKQQVSIHGRHSMVTAAELVKLDGGQIHLG
jgi:hypothetical protein